MTDETALRRPWHLSRRVTPVLAVVAVVVFHQVDAAVVALSVWALLTEYEGIL